ncbi:MAG: nicotinate-nucleotide--dimethylbenzimidazole phosphoribosyltransferase [Proteobacteria bacterium]|nr:nicotinate-nucleotide--dimethylbenzimidazole phosphoribosyltransferase [Pseudomonadota bacterium]
MTYPPPIRSLDDVRALISGLPGPDAEAAAACARREPNLTKPPGSLGRLEELSLWLSSWQGRHPPGVVRVRARVFAANHGVAKRGVSAYPTDVTAQMVANFEAGGAAINQLCRAFGVELKVDALALEHPTRDFTEAPAMDEDECVDAIRAGLAAVEPGTDLLCLGEMGIANSTAAAALCHALYGGEAALWAGPGTGLDGDGVAAKASVVAEAVAFHGRALSDGLEIMRRLGGRELAAIAGAVIGARLLSVPVLLDGYCCTAAAGVLLGLNESALDHCQVGHASAEPGHRRLMERIGKAPLLDLDMRLGEASGAVLAVAIVRAAAACHAGMSTFADAGVSDKG